MILDEDIMRMFQKGKAPSAIDDAFGLSEGTAHDTIIRMWFIDKERGKAAKARALADALNREFL